MNRLTDVAEWVTQQTEQMQAWIEEQRERAENATLLPIEDNFATMNFWFFYTLGIVALTKLFDVHILVWFFSIFAYGIATYEIRRAYNRYVERRFIQRTEDVIRYYEERLGTLLERDGHHQGTVRSGFRIPTRDSGIQRRDGGDAGGVE